MKKIFTVKIKHLSEMKQTINTAEVVFPTSRLRFQQQNSKNFNIVYFCFSMFSTKSFESLNNLQSAIKISTVISTNYIT